MGKYFILYFTKKNYLNKNFRITWKSITKQEICKIQKFPVHNLVLVFYNLLDKIYIFF